ncbi:MAG: hypothetical protein HQL20_08680 [Candidatus Omnitrophica bacterium]|nr:hypothetical protein [Candidatus Omnitrophota bacterium]
MIANILGKSSRTVRRYQKEMREEQSNFEDGNCFNNIFASISRRFQAREAYYICLANTPGLKLMEKLEAMKAAHQVELDMISVFEKLKLKYQQN